MNALLRMVHALQRLYWRLFRPNTRGVKGIVVNLVGEVLLMRHCYEKGWHLPGGGVRRAEDTWDALMREVREETGISDIQHNGHLGTYLNLREYKRDTIEVFIATTTAREASSKSVEVEDAQFFLLSAPPEYLSPGTKRRLAEFRGERLSQESGSLALMKESFGVIPVLRREGEEPLFLLVQHARGSGHWSFAKGGAEAGESPVETARRELREETGISEVDLVENRPLVEEYIYFKDGKPFSKRVTFYLGLVSNERVIPARGEIQDCAWLPHTEALERLTHDEAKEVLRQAYLELKSPLC